MGRARGKDQSWTLCEHRGGEEAEDVLSRIIPKFGDQEFPMKQLLFLPESGWGCRQKGDLSFIWRLLPLGMRAQVRGRLSGFKFGVFRGPIPPLPPVCCLVWSLLDVLAFEKSDSRGGHPEANGLGNLPILLSSMCLGVRTLLALITQAR